MNWKFWKKDDPEEHVEVRSIPFSTLYRWYCYDTGVKDMDKLDKVFDLVPISEDAKEMERAESEQRLDAISHLVPIFEIMASINAEVSVETKVKEMFVLTGLEEGSEELEALTEAMTVLQTFISYSAIVTTFSTAQALGLIEVIRREFEEELIDE